MLGSKNSKVDIIYLVLLLLALLSFALPRKVDAQVTNNRNSPQNQELSLVEYYLGPMLPGRKDTRRFFITLQQLHSLYRRQTSKKTA